MVDVDVTNATTLTDCLVYVDLFPDPTSAPAVRLFFGVVYALIFVLGLVGNIAVVQITITNQKLQTVQNILILNLALSDILVCLLSVPFSPIVSIYKNWYFGTVLCHVIPWVQGMSVFISTYALSMIAVDRYYLIVKPTARKFSVRQASMVTGVFWVFSAIVSLPYAINMTIRHIDTICGEFCQEDWQPTPKFWYTGVVLVLQMLLPFGVMAYCYAVIFMRLKARTNLKLERLARHQSALDSSVAYDPKAPEPSEITMKTFNGQPPSVVDTKNSAGADEQSLLVATNGKRLSPVERFRLKYQNKGTRQANGPSLRHSTSTNDMTSRNQSLKVELTRQKRKNTLILVAMVLIFVVSWLPHHLVSVATEVNTAVFELADGRDYLYLVMLAAHSCAMVNVVLNPVLYAWLNETFRVSVVRAVGRLSASFSSTLRRSTGGGHDIANDVDRGDVSLAAFVATRCRRRAGGERAAPGFVALTPAERFGERAIVDYYRNHRRTTSMAATQTDVADVNTKLIQPPLVRNATTTGLRMHRV